MFVCLLAFAATQRPTPSSKGEGGPSTGTVILWDTAAGDSSSIWEDWGRISSGWREFRPHLLLFVLVNSNYTTKSIAVSRSQETHSQFGSQLDEVLTVQL